MNKKEFSNMMINELNKESEKIFYVQETVKNNGVIFYGISAITEDPIHPVIYLDEIYTKYMNKEMTWDECVSVTKNAYESSLSGKPEIKIEDFTNYESVKSKILPRLINFEGNEKMLQEIPYTKILDLAVIYEITVYIKGDITGSTKITNSLLYTWKDQGVNLDVLHDDAMNNLYDDYVNDKFDLMMIGDMIGKLSGNDDMPEVPFFVLMKKDFSFGAAAMANKYIMLDVLKELEIDEIVILPSSVREVIISDRMGYSEEDIDNFKEMVKSINDSDVVNTEDILSYHIYKFSMKDGLEIIR